MATYSCRSNTSAYTNYYIDYSTSRVENTTTFSFTMKIVQGSASGLGTGNSRNAEIYFDNVLVRTVLVKPATENWAYGTSHTINFSASITTTNTVATNRSCKIKVVVGSSTTGIDSLLWTTYPANFTVIAPAAPNTAPTAPTAFSTDASVYKPNDAIVLTWSGAVDTNIASYTIEESNSPYTSWEATTSAATSSGSGSTTITCPNTRGVTKKYRIKMTDDFGAVSEWMESNAISIKLLPSAPTSLSLSSTTVPTGTAIKISFIKSSQGYQAINNYEAIMINAETSAWYNGRQVMGSSTVSPITVGTAGWTVGYSWRFSIVSVDDFGERSEPSAVSSIIDIIDVVSAAPISELPIVVNGVYLNTFDVIKTTKIMNQLKQIDLYRAKYLAAGKIGSSQNAWCFHGGKAQGWTATNNSGFSTFDSKLDKLCTTDKITKGNLSISTVTYPYLSFKYTLNYKALDDTITKLYASDEIVSISAVLGSLGVSNIDITTDPSYILINSFRFCPKKTYSATLSYTIKYIDFLTYLKKYIQYIKEIYPVSFTVVLTCSDSSTYTISNIPNSYYGYYIANVATVTSNKIITNIVISAGYPTSFPINNNPIKAFQILYDYVKFDDTNVFTNAPVRWELVSASDENDMRSAVETYLGLTESTAVWSDGVHRVKKNQDIANNSHLENYGESMEDIIGACQSCDLFTCSCNETTYGRITCNVCDGTPGVGADAGIPCTRCYTTTYTYQTCTCYSPANALDVGCNCGYASTPMCNGHTCWCNSGTKYTW